MNQPGRPQPVMVVLCNITVPLGEVNPGTGIAPFEDGGWYMKALSLRWVSFFAGCSAALLALAAAAVNVPAILPSHHIHLAWTLTRILIEF